MRVEPGELCKELRDTLACNDLERLSYEALDTDLQDWCKGKMHHEINLADLLLIQQIRLMRQISDGQFGRSRLTPGQPKLQVDQHLENLKTALRSSFPQVTSTAGDRAPIGMGTSLEDERHRAAIAKLADDLERIKRDMEGL